MAKKFKKLLSVVLALVMVVALMPMECMIVHAASYSSEQIFRKAEGWSGGSGSILVAGDSLSSCTNKVSNYGLKNGEIYLDGTLTSNGEALSGVISSIVEDKLYVCSNHTGEAGTLCDNCDPDGGSGGSTTTVTITFSGNSIQYDNDSYVEFVGECDMYPDGINFPSSLTQGLGATAKTGYNIVSVKYYIKNWSDAIETYTQSSADPDGNFMLYKTYKDDKFRIVEKTGVDQYTAIGDFFLAIF